jgi:dienelactone hydrolase
LATVPQAIDYMERRGDVDRGRLGLLGVGLGTDLVMRAAASDRQVGSVVALSPLLTASGVQPGLDLLREMSYIEALRWRRLHQGGQLVSQLAALEHMPGLAARPLLVISGGMDRLAPRVEKQTLPRGAELKIVKSVGRRGLAQDSEVLSSSAGWFLSHL